jgi:recombination protein RecA
MIGNRTRVKVAKNKVAPPFKKAEFDIIYGEGISNEGCILDVGVEAGIVDKAGAWYSYGDVRLGQGRDNSKQFLMENREIMDEIENKVREKYNLQKKQGKTESKKEEKDNK